SLLSWASLLAFQWGLATLMVMSCAPKNSWRRDLVPKVAEKFVPPRCLQVARVERKRNPGRPIHEANAAPGFGDAQPGYGPTSLEDGGRTRRAAQPRPA